MDVRNKGLPELKIVHQKTKIDCLGGSEGLYVILMYSTVYRHISKKEVTRSYDGVGDKA